MDFKKRHVPFILCLFAALSAPAMAAPPTLGAVSTLSGSPEDTNSTITYSALLNAADEADADGGTIQFRLKSILGGATMSASVGDTITTGGTWTWTPAADAFGEIAAFTVVAYDGSSESSTPVTVKVNVPAVNDIPSFTKGANVTRAEDVGNVEIAGWATNISKGPANESGQTVEFIVASNSRPALFAEGPAVSADGRLTFKPAANANGSATIGLKINDHGGTTDGGVEESAVQTFTITITPVDDAPALAGTIDGTTANPLTDAPASAGNPPAAQALFSTVTVADVDHDMPNAESLTVTVTLSKNLDQYGTISTPPGNSVRTIVGDNYVYTISNRTPAQAQSDLRATRFTPLANVMPVGLYDFDAKVEVRDSSNLTATPLESQVTVRSANDAPSVNFVLFPASVSDGVASNPFRVTINDVDQGETFSAEISEVVAAGGSARGTLSSTRVTGTAAEIASRIQTISYTPFPQTAASQATNFKISVTDIHPDGTSGTPVDQTKALTVTFTNTPPEITGASTNLIRMTDDETAALLVFPFPTVTIADGNAGQGLEVTLILDDAAKGKFKEINSSGVAVELANSKFSGTASQVTERIRKLHFVPTANRLPINQTETVTVTISVTDMPDTNPLTRTNNQTQIVVTSVNGAPVVTWGDPVEPFPTSGNPAPIAPNDPYPFKTVKFGDEGDIVVTITLDAAAKGKLTSDDQIAPFFSETPAGSGTYKFTGSPANAATAIAKLKFEPSADYSFPAGQPGRTDFTIRASDSVSNVTTRVLPVVLVSDAKNLLVTSIADSATTPGTLRHAISIAAPNDVITFALPAYPATLRLVKANGPLVIEKHLTFKGPGADKLTITGDANSNGSTDAGDVQIFQIYSSVEIDGLKLARGFAGTGGAISVGRSQPGVPAGSLRLINSTVSDCVATQWGGGIDVVEGSLAVENSLFVRNSLAVSSGLGGGAVSLFTHAACSFTNTTFSGNAKYSTSGIGGGALFVENDVPESLFETKVTHCTFTGNSDGQDRGSSIHSNVSNSRVIVANTIFADASAHNLFVAGAGEIISKGGNLSTDKTTTTFLVGGNPQSVTLLNHVSDKREINPLLNALGDVGGQTEAHSLKAGSPAAGAGLPEFSTGVDQRGVVRDATVDSGAVDAEALGRLVIHEIAAPQTNSEDFIEFYNPRNQGVLDLTGSEVWIDGVKASTFTTTLKIQPGFGFILGNGNVSPVTTDTPVVTLNPSATLALKSRGRIEIRKPVTVPGSPLPVTVLRTIAAASYNTVFANQTDRSATEDYGNDSVTLAPQFGGASYVPHRLVQVPPAGGALLSATGAARSPGADTGGTPFGKDNAYPIATTDRFEVTEDELATLNVLGNDLDSDGADGLFIIDVNTTDTPATPTSSATALSATGAAVTVNPNASPLRGTNVGFDPRTAFNNLPEGARVFDTFAYSIIDVGTRAIGSYADGGTATNVSAPGHRLVTGETVTITGSSIAAYNGTHVITSVDAETFSIPVVFTQNPPADSRGRWLAAVPRSDTQRATALVQVTVLGRNDPPTPATDTVATAEDTILRILGDPTLAGSSAVFDTDASYPAPRKLSQIGILANDSDPDTDDMPYSKLRVVGVCQAKAISGYSNNGTSVTVTAPGHGLATGATVLVSGYGGHPSYNGYHLVTVTGPDTFTIPVGFIDDAAQKGVWAILGDSSRLATTSSLGASVTLEIRANRAQTNIVYNPRPSAFIDGLAIGEQATDSFYYAVEDTHGAVSLAPLSVTVTGTNDVTVPGNDPAGLAAVGPYLTGGVTLSTFIRDSELLHLIPSANGTTNVAVRPPGGGFADRVVLEGVRQTDEDTAIAFTRASLTANDSDIDRNDTLVVEIAAGQNLSREGAAVSLNPDGSVNYNPAGSVSLQSLARGESVVDTFNITVFDGTSRVTSLVAVLVKGLNDSPVALADSLTTPEKTLLESGSPGLLANDSDKDRNTNLPDNRKMFLPVRDSGTTVFGAKVNVGMVRRDGTIDGFSAVSGNAAVTRVTSAGHGMSTGEEVVIVGAGALTGQYPVTVLNTDSFTIPVAYNSAYSGLSGAWNVLRNTFSYDPRGSVSTLNPADSTFTLQGLAAGETYNDTFTYTMLDGSFLFANDDIFRVEADKTGIELNVLLNDTNLEGLATSRKIVEVGPTSAGGTVTLNGTASLIYTPETGFVGDEVFTYTIEDSLGNRATATVTARVTVNRLNGNLQANDDRFTAAAGQSPLLQVIANDDIIPATGSPLTLVAVTAAPDHGGTAVIQGGAIRFTPDPSATVFPYTETFSYSISGGGSARATARVTLLVVDRANTLNLRQDSFTVAAGSAGNSLNVLANDNILPGTGTALQLTALGTPSHGTAAISGNAITYTPAAGFLGTDVFTYSAADGFGGTGTATIRVTVGHLVTNSDFFAVPFDSPLKTTDDQPTELDVLANDSVVMGGGGRVSITAVTPSSTPLGTMAIKADGTRLVFDPAPSANGQQEFTYTVTDATGRTATNTVTVLILSQGVRANSDAFTVQADSLENFLSLVANDLRISTIPGTLAIASIGTGPNAPDQGGSVTISENLEGIIYTPAPGFRGVESFTYTVTDGDFVDTARVTIRTTSGELAAGDDSFFAFRGSSANVLNVLANDRVIPDNGDLLSITAVDFDSANAGNPAIRGQLEIVPGGTQLLYTPAPENTAFPYTETFTYEISDGGTRRSEAVIRIEVLDRIGARDLDTNNDAFTVKSDSGATVFNVLANDNIRPATSEGWTITSVTAPNANVSSPILGGSLVSPATLAAKLAAHANPVSLFLWNSISPADQTVLADPSANATLRMNALLSALNTAATGAPIYDSARFSGVTLREQTSALLGMNPTGERLIVLNRLLLEDAYPADLLPAAGGGNALISGSSIIYVPQPGFVGFERFTYFVSDGLGGTGHAEVIVRVGDISVSDDLFAAVAGAGPVLLDVTANDGILRDAFPAVPAPGSADFTLATERAVEVSPSIAGSASLQAGKVSFSPAAGFAGIATLTYWVKDDGAHLFPGTARVDVRALGEDRTTAVATVTVTGVNDAPQLLSANLSAVSDKAVVKPFPDATVIEFDSQRQELVTLRITFPAERGILAGAFTLVSPGVLEMTGTAAQLTTALRALTFTPAGNRITVGTTEVTEFGVTLDDHKVTTPVVADPARATVTPVNDIPVFSGTVANQLVYMRDTLKPFSNVDLFEIDNLGLQPLTITIRASNTFTGSLSGGGFSEQPGGSRVYTFTGTAAAGKAAMRSLVFSPTPGTRVTPSTPETVGLRVEITDHFGGNLTDTTTSAIVVHGEVDRVLAFNPNGTDGSQAQSSFGSSVAISGDTMVVGSPQRDSTTLGDTGKVFVYKRGTTNTGAPWVKVTELAASDAFTNDQFGSSVAIDGDVIVVGAPLADLNGSGNTGAIYVFQRDSSNPDLWTQTKRLNGPSPAGGDQLGTAVAIKGGTILGGAPQATSGTYALGGKVHVYERDLGGTANWGVAQTILAPIVADTGEGSGNGYYFGQALAVDGNTAVIGAPGANSPSRAADMGAACIYQRSGPGGSWSLARKLDIFSGSDSSANDRFGAAVDVEGDVIVVGVDNHNRITQPESGVAFVYERNLGGTEQWGLARRLESDVLLSNELFGRSVAVSGELVMVGAPRLSTFGTTQLSGAAFVYRRNEGGSSAWGQIDKFSPGATTTRDRFGYSIALDGFTGVVGAIGDNVNATSAINAGSARVYQFHHNSVSPVSPLASAYSTWSASRFNPATLNNPGERASVWGSQADPDGDGMVNLIEMLFGTAPTTGGQSPATFAKNSDGSVTFSFPNSGNLTPDLYHVEWSVDLSTWSRSDITSVPRTGPNSSQWIDATVRPSTPQKNVFVRIMVGP